jgi:hypothetical protein
MIQLICAVDRGELMVAREYLESSLQRIPAPEKAPDAGCAAEMALYMAYLDGHALRAGPWLRGAEALAAARKVSLTGDCDYWRAVTAVRKAEGLRGEADEAWHRAVYLAEQRPSTGNYRFERELLEKVRNEDWLHRHDSALSEA